MPKLVAKVQMKSAVCSKCGNVSFFLENGDLDGFVRFGCRHLVWELLERLLKEEIEARGKGTRVAKNPNGRKPKPKKRKP